MLHEAHFHRFSLYECAFSSGLDTIWCPQRNKILRAAETIACEPDSLINKPFVYSLLTKLPAPELVTTQGTRPAAYVTP